MQLVVPPGWQIWWRKLGGAAGRGMPAAGKRGEAFRSIVWCVVVQKLRPLSKMLFVGHDERSPCAPSGRNRNLIGRAIPRPDRSFYQYVFNIRLKRSFEPSPSITSGPRYSLCNTLVKSGRSPLKSFTWFLYFIELSPAQGVFTRLFLLTFSTTRSPSRWNGAFYGGTLPGAGPCFAGGIPYCFAFGPSGNGVRPICTAGGRTGVGA